MKRLAIISVPMDVLGDVLLGRARVVGFPPDAAFLRAYYAIECDSIEFLLEHPSFSEVLPGERAPVLSLGWDYMIGGV